MHVNIINFNVKSKISFLEQTMVKVTKPDNMTNKFDYGSKT